MVGFCDIVVAKRNDFGNNLGRVFFLLAGNYLFDRRFIGRILVIDAAAVLYAAIVALPVQACRVDHFKEIGE